MEGVGEARMVGVRSARVVRRVVRCMFGDGGWDVGTLGLRDLDDGSSAWCGGLEKSAQGKGCRRCPR